LTIEQDRSDLEWHEEKHDNREVFAFTVLNTDRSKCLGCFYLYPSDRPEFDAEVYFWVTEMEFNKGLEDKLFAVTKTWLDNKWPFKNVIFPNRDSDGRFDPSLL